MQRMHDVRSRPVRTLQAPPPRSALQRKCACGGGSSCACGRREPHDESLRAALRSPAQSLDTETRRFFEPRLGFDFGSVRVHVGETAARSAREERALAYTFGSHVVFASGAYAPKTEDGRKLLGHELTHVVQQAGAARERPGSPEAEASADRFAATMPTMPTLRANAGAAPVPSPATVQRKPAALTPRPEPSCATALPMSFYESSPRWCADSPGTGQLHPGQVCFREIPAREDSHHCPPGAHVCFDPKTRRCADYHVDKVTPVDERSGRVCALNTRCAIEHGFKDKVIEYYLRSKGIDNNVSMPGDDVAEQRREF